MAIQAAHEARLRHDSPENSEIDRPQWHQLRAARLRERISLRTVAKRLGITTAEAGRREAPEHDLSLSEIHGWSLALRVPPQELLFGVNDRLDAEVAARACLVRTARLLYRLQRRVPHRGLRVRAAAMLNEIIEAMPEVQKLVETWSEKRRKPDDALGACLTVTNLIKASRRLYRRLD